MNERIEVKSHGEIRPKKGMNPRNPYEHQKCAMMCMDQMNELPAYRTLIVLPTGGGKTYTATLWLLKNVVDQHKKILWIAHRQLLLDQAAESFQKFAYESDMINHTAFSYRIISGSQRHDRSIDISPDDQVIIASKDSIGRNLGCLDEWLKDEREVYLVIDEAHHSTAKTYRNIIDYVDQRIPQLKLIGLTATPFRTAEEEQGLLSKIYTDGVRNGNVVQHDIGISYQIDLKELINRQILSKPIFESYFTDENYGSDIGLQGWEQLQHLDILPEKLAKEMAESAARNHLIVDAYCKKQKEYGQTLVFVISQTHAIQLCALFKQAGIKADYIVSGLMDSVTLASLQYNNDEKIEEYRKGNIQVLINVNILTEGVDLPQTKTVFLTRPTVSTTLMTQMVGRALRGTMAGGTNIAYIVSFIDHWNEHIAWVNPETLFIQDAQFKEDDRERANTTLQLIAVAKIEEFAKVLDSTIDTTSLERVPFEKRIPVGMYAFTYLEEHGMDHSYQVMVYDSTKQAYEHMMEELKDLFTTYEVQMEYLPEDILHDMEQHCRDTYFYGEMIPPYESRDIIQILKYYAQYEAVPRFYTFDEIDRDRLDVGKIAQDIWNQDLGQRQKALYIDELWNQGDENILRMFFGKKMYFVKQVDVEILKLSHPDLYNEDQNVTYGTKALEDLSLYEIGKIDPAYEKKLRDTAFSKSLNDKREYTCASCGKSSYSRALFQVDHITPMNKGGKSVPDNLQILCRKCNAMKSDH